MSKFLGETGPGLYFEKGFWKINTRDESVYLPPQFQQALGFIEFIQRRHTKTIAPLFSFPPALRCWPQPFPRPEGRLGRVGSRALALPSRRRLSGSRCGRCSGAPAATPRPAIISPADPPSVRSWRGKCPAGAARLATAPEC